MGIYPREKEMMFMYKIMYMAALFGIFPTGANQGVLQQVDD